MNKIFLILAFLALSIILGSCCKESKKALPDLIQQGVDITNKISNGFEVNDVGEIAIFIINAADALDDCGTKDANSNEHEVGLYHRANSTSNFTKVGKADYSMQRLSADDVFEDAPTVQFTVPGQYFIGDMADINKIVSERDETNNGKDSEGVEARSTSGGGHSVAFWVNSNPEIEKRIAAGEKIPFCKFNDRPNLIRYSVKELNGDWITVKVR